MTVPSTQYLRFLVPKTIPVMVLGNRSLKYGVLGPSRSRIEDSSGWRSSGWPKLPRLATAGPGVRPKTASGSDPFR